MSADILGALNEVVSDLKEAGVATTLETSRLEVPGVLVTAGQIDFSYQDRTNFDLELKLYAVASASKSHAETYKALQGLLEKISTVYEVDSLTPLVLPLTQGADPYPAWEITLQVRITED